MKFGELLQSIRVNANVSLRELGRAVSLSPVYLSDIERGQRRPPAPPIVLRMAATLKTDPLNLMRAALAERDAIELALPNTDSAGARYEAALALARVWDTMDDDALTRLKDQLEKQILKKEE